MEKVTVNFSKYVADDRKALAALLKTALSSLICDDTDLMIAIRNIVEYHENETDSYPVVSLSRDDIRDVGYNPNGLTNDDMRNLTQEMYTDDINESFWHILEQTVEEVQLPELRTETDDLYKEYVRENTKPPLYADIWLEDAGCNNQPWKETVKLSLDVEKQYDEDIYMYFNGYDELKRWLYCNSKDLI